MANSHMKMQSCTCGNYSSVPEDRQGMERSFVHLAHPSWFDERDMYHHEAQEPGFLDTARHASALLRAGQGKALPQNDNDIGVALCQYCIERVIRAIDADTERLEDECVAYRKAVTDEKERQDKLRAALMAARWSHSGSSHGPGVEAMIEETEANFLDEIGAFNDACEQHESELRNLRFLQHEQTTISQELDHTVHCIEDQKNSIHLEARAFGHVHHQFADKLRSTQDEIQALSEVRVHSVLFDLVVDKRGLRYPLINDLRLAYRPKGDVNWTEINAAWSQAAQLMLLVAASVSFRSNDWRIVPITSCAKLIYLEGKRRQVFNLGGNLRDARANMSSALRAANALLDQLCRHVIGMMQEMDVCTPPLPFDMSRGRIGPCELAQLEPSDDTGWARVIYCMASNLHWLSLCASECELLLATLAV